MATGSGTSPRPRTVNAIADAVRAEAGADAMLPEEQLPRWTVAGVTPVAVVLPDSVGLASAILGRCSAEGWPVEPAGAATWLRAGRPPAAPPVVISTSRLRRIREHEPADLVVGVEAGLALAALDEAVGRHGQTVPLDPPASDQASIGATVALGAAGPLRALHGTPRDMVLGVEVVTGDGRVLHFGGRVVKNVAGFDIVRLLTGSRGSLGLITSLHIRLRGRPERDATSVIELSDAAAAASLAGAIRSRMDADALEVLGPADPAGDATGWTVLVRTRGSEAAVVEALGTVAELAERSGVVMPVVDAEAPAGDRGKPGSSDPWRDLSTSEANAEVSLSLADQPSRLPATLTAALELAELASGGGAGWRVAAHGTAGIVRLWSVSAPAAVGLERLAAALPEAARKLASTGGTLTWPCWTTRAGAAAPARESSRSAAELRLMRDLMERFDPAGISSPDRHIAVSHRDRDGATSPTQGPE